MCNDNQKLHQQEYLLSPAKYGGGGVIIWDSFTIMGLENYAVIDLTPNSSVYRGHIVC